jgi:hypothetical protein
LSVPQAGWPVVLNPAIKNPNHTESAAPAAASHGDTDARLEKANAEVEKVTKELAVARRHVQTAQSMLANAPTEVLVVVDEEQVQAKEREVRNK